MVLYQPQNGYCYNSDTHFLYNFICKSLEKYKNISGEVLDIGSGSGILGLLFAKRYSKINLNQVEIQETFQFFSTKNAITNKINSKMNKGSFLEIEFDMKFDICLSNPPFYHSDVIKSEIENLKIARYNDYMPLRDFIKRASEVLKNGGKFFFCYDCKQLDDIILYLKEFKFNIETLQFVYPSTSKDATLVMIYAKKDSKSLLKVLTPLIVFDEKNEFTKTVKNIYNEAQTHSIKALIE
ncbi:methyltransferase [Aliarcobacter trophiarum LMG 25534]|uniref:Methyltransferase n=1 Tax=Aliarcobacter trophiarum LMG 25534 TaxID=1032241 RepID=A0AAD0QJ23_9BACT|nr:methyltransferase [Aliarcobacter trophiarum]AXK48939.1 tRNA m6A37 methyltransferase [Aliarcobacter trophiarum LMG 25534]RXI24881.1 methyltransferase [Aliarcobacter trophiarum]RXJ92670.1 methyltransferase [Aliarcobacter trophiarum LMG 25534]